MASTEQLLGPLESAGDKEAIRFGERALSYGELRDVAAELIVFVRETVRELGEHRASGFLKKFYGWYLGRGRFPKPFKQELVQLESTEEVVTRLLAASPGAAELVERLEAELPDPADEILLDSMPISIYGGG